MLPTTGANPFVKNRDNRTALDLALIENASRHLYTSWLRTFDRYGFFAEELMVPLSLPCIETADIVESCLGQNTTSGNRSNMGVKMGYSHSPVCNFRARTSTLFAEDDDNLRWISQSEAIVVYRSEWCFCRTRVRRAAIGMTEEAIVREGVTVL